MILIRNVWLLCLFVNVSQVAFAQEATSWQYTAEQLQPFWQGDVIDSESVLFVRDSDTQEARGSLLFPIEKVLAVRNAAGDITYTAGTDYRFEPGTRELTIPTGSRIATHTPADLRRPAGSQRYALTHRDGNGEIFFGARLEYHNMQTCVTYAKADRAWPLAMPAFDADALPRTIAKLRAGEPVSIVLLGDSISTGCNASGWAGGAPLQPAYPELLAMHLKAHYGSDVTLTNLSVGGTSTPWGISKIGEVVELEPDLVMLAFGMNDSAGRSAREYQENTTTMIARTRETLPHAEFVLIASMLGNRDWTRLDHSAFPKYRDALRALRGPGIALADMTSVWEVFLTRKRDWDLTGNGVNHPNDFGHRVYAQVLSAILINPELLDR